MKKASIVMTFVGTIFAVGWWAGDISSRTSAIEAELKELSASIDERFEAVDEKFTAVIRLIIELGKQNVKLTAEGEELYKLVGGPQIVDRYLADAKISLESVSEFANVLFVPPLTLDRLSPEEQERMTFVANAENIRVDELLNVVNLGLRGQQWNSVAQTQLIAQG